MFYSKFSQEFSKDCKKRRRRRKRFTKEQTEIPNVIQNHTGSIKNPFDS